MIDASPVHNLAFLLQRTARSFPSLPAVARGEATVLRYDELSQRVTKFAAGLLRLGLSPGDRVALAAANCVEYVEVLFAVWQAGLCAVPINAKLHPDELGFILHDAQAKAVLVDAAWANAIDAGRAQSLRVIEIGSAEYRGLLDHGEGALSPVRPNTPAWLFYTSGTTGKPKGVVLAHTNLLAMSLCFLADVESVEPGDAILHPAPMSHGSGLYLLPHVLRGAVQVIPESGGFAAEETFALLDAHPRACFFAAPTMIKRLLSHPQAERDYRGLKSIVAGGAPLYLEDCRAAARLFGPRLAQIYGQGETPMTITAMARALLADALARDDEARLVSVGVAQMGIEIRIGDAAHPLSPGEAGEVLVRGPTVMQGYWRNPEASAKTLAGGWLHTGDIGCLDEDGFLTLKDRSKDLIISGGSNIYPREVEEVLLRHPGVAEAAVVGRTHAEWGEEVVACVVAKPGATLSAPELDAVCLQHIARFKRPRAYVFLDALPKNNTGKVLKSELRARIATEVGAAEQPR